MVVQSLCKFERRVGDSTDDQRKTPVRAEQ